MNHEEAKEILSSYRASGRDAHDPAYAEALELARRDPELAAWFAREQEFDARMAGALRSVQPPRDFQAALAASSKVAQFPAPRRRLGPWLLALAACLAVGAGLFLFTRENRLPASVFTAEMAPLVDRHRHALETTPAKADELRAWFAGQGAPSDFAMPRGLLSARGVGCEVVTMNGAKVSLLCFPNGHGGVAHLYVIDRGQLAGAPAPADGPSFHMEGGVAVAMWSDEKHTYLLASRGDVDSLKPIL